MSTQALYRKYRSRDFSQVLGQPQVVQTLTNAIQSGRISHAYLFTGPRGTGKTSVARLLARAVNCTGEQKPCNACTSCQTDLNGHLDLIEIDAASNRRIDEIRELRDKVGLAPSMGQYKVYIIDEVHMLTTEAANALLKTLEEPPAHVIFILATTEAHKLPETIISRTQRFSFRPITEADLITGLKNIAKAEGIKADDDALQLLASASRGGFRDAISLLDQASSLGQTVTANSVRQALGWAEQGIVDGIISAMVDNDTAIALQLLDQAASDGAPASQLISQLSTRLRAAMLLQAGVKTNPDQFLSGLPESLTAQYLAKAIDRLAIAAKSAWPEVALETAIVDLVAPTSVEVHRPALAAAPPTQATPAQPPRAAATKPTPPPQKAAEAAAAPAGDLWMKALSLIKQHNNSLYALLRSCDSQLQGDQLVITCRFNFHRDRLNETKNRLVIEQALAKAFGRPLKAVCQLETVKAAPASENELVSTALEILGGEIVDE